jgi:GNAT superfamily N-acetyltransferase
MPEEVFAMLDQPSAVLELLDDNLCAAWSGFGRWSRGRLHESDELVWYETPIPSVPYNAVLRMRARPETDVEELIRSIVRACAQRGAQLTWVVSPLSRPADLHRRLEGHGFACVQEMTGMAMALDDLTAQPLPEGVRIEPVGADRMSDDYMRLQISAWHLPQSTTDLLQELAATVTFPPGQEGCRWLAYDHGVPVGKCYVFLMEGTVGIYGVLTVPEVRGRGIGSALVTKALLAAREKGCRYAILHSTPVAVNLYRRLGFREYAPFRAYVHGLTLHV